MSSSTYEIHGTFAGAEAIIKKFEGIEKAVKSVESALKAQSRASGLLERESRQRTGRLRDEEKAARSLAERYDRWHRGSREVKQIWREAADSLSDYKSAASRLLGAEARFKALRLSADDTAKGLQAVQDVALRVGGVRFSDLTEDLTGLKSVFGDIHTAIEMLPLAAKTRFTFQTLFQADPKQLERDILSTMKALEQMGAVRQLPGGGVDTQRFKEYFDAIIKIKSYTGGRVGGAELKQFVGKGGLAAMGVSPEGLLHMASLMEAMGGATTGTSFMSAVMSFRGMRQGAGGGMSADALAKLGLLDMSKVELTRERRIKKALPGAMPIAELLGDNPIQFTDALAEAIKKHGKNVLGREADITSARDVGDIMMRITPNRRAGDVLAKMILMRENIAKDVRAMQQSEGLEDLNKRAEDSPLGKLLKWEAALENFREKAGIPLMEALGGISSAAMPFLNFLGQHPKAAMWTMVMLKFGSATFRSAAALEHLRGSAAMISMSRAVAPIAATTKGVEAATKKVNYFKRELTGIPATLYTTVVLTLGSAVIGYIMKLKAEADQAWADAKATAEGHKQTLSTLYASPGTSTDLLKRLGRGDAGNVLGLLKGDTAIENALSSFKGGVVPFDVPGLNSLLGRLGPMERAQRIAEQMRNLAPELSMPSRLAMFKEALGKDRSLSREQRQDLWNAAQLAHGESFKKYSEAINQAKGDEHAALTLLIEQDKKAAQEAAKLSERLSKAAAAAESYADRVNNLDLLPGGQQGEGGVQVPQSDRGGGLTRRGHLTAARHDTSRAGAEKEIAAAVRGEGAAGVPPITFAPTVPLQVINGDPATVQRAALAGILQAKRELERTLTISMKDRALST